MMYLFRAITLLPSRIMSYQFSVFGAVLLQWFAVLVNYSLVIYWL